MNCKGKPTLHELATEEIVSVAFFCAIETTYCGLEFK